jgi:hypothetical protein
MTLCHYSTATVIRPQLANSAEGLLPKIAEPGF